MTYLHYLAGNGVNKDGVLVNNDRIRYCCLEYIPYICNNVVPNLTTMRFVPKPKLKLNKNLPIGLVIRQIREAQRYKQAELARMVEITRNHICEIESGDSHPSYKVLTDILFVLGYELTVKKIPKQKKNAPADVPIANGAERVKEAASDPLVKETGEQNP